MLYESFVIVTDDIIPPKENQIVFTHDNYPHSPMMTWKYREVRIVTEISVLPVPFHVASEVFSKWIEETSSSNVRVFDCVNLF